MFLYKAAWCYSKIANATEPRLKQREFILGMRLEFFFILLKGGRGVAWGVHCTGVMQGSHYGVWWWIILRAHFGGGVIWGHF